MLPILLHLSAFCATPEGRLHMGFCYLLLQTCLPLSTLMLIGAVAPTLDVPHQGTVFFLVPILSRFLPRDKLLYPIPMPNLNIRPPEMPWWGPLGYTPFSQNYDALHARLRSSIATMCPISIFLPVLLVINAQSMSR